MKKSELYNKMTKNIVVTESITFATAMGEKNISTNAASITFFFFISIIPLFILLCSLLPYTGIGEAELTRAITQITPEAIDELIASIISEAYSSKMAIFSISVVFLLWSSSKGMLALVRALDFIYEEDDNRSYISMVGYSLLYTVLLIAAAGLLLLLYTKERSADEIIIAALPTKSVFRDLTEKLNNLNVVLTVIVFCVILYTFVPAGRRRLMFQLPGAVFSGAATAVFSGVFSVYSGGHNIYNSFYGSLTSIAVFLMWMYFYFNIFLVGAVINTHFKGKFESIHRKFKVKRRERRDKKHEKKRAK